MATSVNTTRWESVTDKPLLVLAVATIPLLVVEATTAGAPAVAAVVANWTIWGCFAVDLVVRTWQARPGWRRYLRTHPIDIAIVVVTVIPYLLPLRALRSAYALRMLRVVRVAAYTARIWQTAMRQWHTPKALLIVMPVVVVTGATGVWFTESGTNSALGHYGDALWWSLVTVTTVGYGDIAPVTTTGRIIAAVLMLVGIGTFGIVTANIARYVIRRDGRDTDE